MRRKAIILGLFLAGLLLVAVIGRQLILGNTLQQQPTDTSPTSESLSKTLTDPARPNVTLQEGVDYTLENERYFDNNSWYVATVTPTQKNAAEPAVVVMKLKDSSYEIVVGPGTSFPAQDLKDIPKEVVDYLKSQGRVSDEIY